MWILLLVAVVTALILWHPWNPTPTPTPAEQQTESDATAPDSTASEQPATPDDQQSALYVSLNYDETNGDPLTTGQMQLIARYLRIPAPISQAALEAAISQIQQEAVAAHATTFQGQILTLDQRQAWFIWCSDARMVDPPSDVIVVQPTRPAPETFGSIWVQIPFAPGVPRRVDDTWRGCNSPSGFWAVAVH